MNKEIKIAKVGSKYIITPYAGELTFKTKGAALGYIIDNLE